MKSQNKTIISFNYDEIANNIAKISKVYNQLGCTAEIMSKNLQLLIQQTQMNQALMDATIAPQNKKDPGEFFVKLDKQDSTPIFHDIELDEFDKILINNDYFDL